MTMTLLDRPQSPAPTAPPDIDIAIPVYNEEQALAPSIERLHGYLRQHFPLTWRITIVDNASTDSTWAEATRLAEAFDEVEARHLDRKGRGRALREAWGVSDADVVVYMDVDLSTDLDGLLPLVAPLVSGHSDVAIGSRLLPGSVVARGPKRELISRSYNAILRLLFATRFRDAQCGFKAVRADVVRRLLPAIEDQAWFFDTELLLLAEHNGLRVHEVPVDWVDDPDTRVQIVSTATDDLRGVARMARKFASGEGQVDLSDLGRPPLADDFGRRLVSFAVIGTASTVVSILLYLLLRGPLGPIAANAVAITSTFIANTWANRHWTVHRGARSQHLLGSVSVYVGSLLVTTAALALVGAMGGGAAAEVAALAVTWTAATLVRLVLIRSWSRAEVSR